MGAKVGIALVGAFTGCKVGLKDGVGALLGDEVGAPIDNIAV